MVFRMKAIKEKGDCKLPVSPNEFFITPKPLAIFKLDVTPVYRFSLVAIPRSIDPYLWLCTCRSDSFLTFSQNLISK